MGLVKYLRTNLKSPTGGYYSAEDADSLPDSNSLKKKGIFLCNKSEGAFYVWTRKEVESILGEDSSIFSDIFDVKENGNVPSETDPHDELAGQVY